MHFGGVGSDYFLFGVSSSLELPFQADIWTADIVFV